MLDFRSSKKYLEVSCLNWNYNSSWLAFGTSTGDIEILDFKKKAAIASYSKKNYDGIRALKFSPYAKNTLCSGCKDGSIGVYSIQQPDLVSRYWKLHSNKVTGIGFTSINEDLVISCSLDETLAFLDIRQKKVANTINMGSALTCLSVSPSGYNIVTGSYFGEIKGIDIRKEDSTVMKYKGHKGMVKSIDYSKVVKSNRRADSMSMLSNNKTQKNEGYSRLSDKKEASFIQDASFTRTVREKVDTSFKSKSNQPVEPKIANFNTKTETEYMTESYKVNNLVKKPEIDKKIEEALAPRINGVVSGLSADDKDEIKDFIRAEVNALRLDMIKEFELQRFEFRKMLEEMKNHK